MQKQTMVNKTHDGIPQAMFKGGKSNFLDKSGKHSKKQGAAARSNNSTSVAAPGRTPITVTNKKKPMPMDPMEILSALGGK